MERSPRKIPNPQASRRIIRRRTAAYTPRRADYVSLQGTLGIRSITPKSAASSVRHADTAKHHRKKHGWQSAVLYGMATCIFTVGLFVCLNGFRANRQVAAQVKHSQKQTDASVSDTVVPSTTQPSATTVKNYVVASNLPKYLDIPKLNIHARILSEGVTKSGQLQVPWNIYDAGWYNASAQPGQMGSMLVDGHSGIGKTHGVFYQLGSLTTGDTITVTRGDNKQFTYVVARVQTLDVGSVKMSDMLVSANTSKPGLNLITCAGELIPGTDQLNKRVQVYAVLQ